jgi:DNA-binding SARP family transcriptional activator
VVLGLTQLLSSQEWTQCAGAATSALTSVDQIDQSFQIPVTDSTTHVEYPSVLVVHSASLNTTPPKAIVGSGPRDFIFLILNLTSGPVQSQFGDATWGDFYSNMVPLPATAIRYITASGRSYVAKRIDPSSAGSFANADSDDGLVDATYFFTVPISNRSGTLEILPSRTFGTRYEDFDGVGATALVTGGPVKVTLRFPMRLTATPTSPVTRRQSASASYATFNSMLNFASMLLGVLIVGVVYLRIRRSRRRRDPRGPPLYVVREQREPARPSSSSTVVTPAATSSHMPEDVPSDSEGVHDTLHVNVLGNLELSPTLAIPSDPVRAIIAYLAMHSERPLTLDEIQTAIWPLTEKGSDIKRPAMRNYMVDARKVVGDQHLPTASGRPGYQLVDVTTDWDEFQGLLDQARGLEKTVSSKLRKEALALIRGVPFTADTSRYFTWAFSSAVVYKIVETVTGVAHDLATEMVLASDLVGAEWCLRQGLLCEPASLILWEDLTDVLLETADQSLLELHWKAAALALDTKDVVALRAREHG